MKYHYQFVSTTTVRIELIPEDQKEAARLAKFPEADECHIDLMKLFTAGLQHYHSNSRLIKVNFMNFPKVALCSFTEVTQEKIIPIVNLAI